MNTALIGIACTIAGILISYVTFWRNTKKDAQDDGKASGAMMSELGYIKANTDDIKAEQREQRKINNEMYTRVSACEQSCASAHKRLDRIERREA